MTSAVSDSLVIFELAGQQLALSLSCVEGVIRSVEVSPLPEAPAGVRGVINFHGRIVPVLDLTARLGLAPRELRLSDHFVIAHTQRRTVALIVDCAIGVVPRAPAKLTTAEAIVPGLAGIQGVMRLNGDLVLIHDLESFLSPQAAEALTQALPT